MQHEISGRTALVLETNNLRGGGATVEAAAASLLRLLERLNQQSLPLNALSQVVITHDGLSGRQCEAVIQLAGRAVDFVRIDTATGYYDAKNAGFEATDAQRCDYVAFADADCLPDRDWLAELLAPLAMKNMPPPPVIAGRTSYAANLVGTALTTLDFMYFPNPAQTGATKNFYANNVVFRRDVFERHRYQVLDGVYRANCQVLGLRLLAASVPVHFAERAHTVHRLPDTRGECLKLRWLRGQDTCGLTPHLVRAHLPASLQWLGRSGPIGPMCVLLTRLACSLRALNHQSLPRLRGLRWLAGAALICGFSAIDMLGALCRGVGLQTRGAGADARALSYHRP